MRRFDRVGVAREGQAGRDRARPRGPIVGAGRRGGQGRHTPARGGRTLVGEVAGYLRRLDLGAITEDNVGVFGTVIGAITVAGVVATVTAGSGLGKV
jgi:hypothetical protein